MTAITWSEAARRLFDLTGPTAVSAGAGSGKTTCLVELCLRLLSGEATGTPCEPAALAAITFTEKAAAELVERLRGGVRGRLAAAAGEEAVRWRARLDGLAAMHAGTIHGFAARLLREHALRAGVDPEFEVADEARADRWRREAARDAVVAALDAGRPEARLLAGAHGAGGGGRAGLTELVAGLVQERASLGDEGPMAPAPEDPAEERAARARVLSAAASVVALGPTLRTASGKAAVARLATALAAVTSGDREGPPSPALLRRVAELASALKGWRVGATDPEEARALREALAEAAARHAEAAAEVLSAAQKRELCALVADAERRYAVRRAGARALDFDDLLLRARALLRDDAAVRAAARGSLRALLVDEVQDVNAVQRDLFDLLAREEPGAPAGPLLVAVGDLKQSIYRFRGADVGVFREVLERLAADGASGGPGRVLHLSDNHRSSAGVLALVNEVSSRAMRPPAGVAGRPYELQFEEADRLRAMRAGGDAPACELLEDGGGGAAAERRAREGQALAARIGAWLTGAAGEVVRERTPDGGERARRARPGDVAILFRRLTQLGPYERALREAGIPYRVGRGGGFFRAPEVRDLGELLATLASPSDALAWAAVLRSPLCGLGDGALFALARAGAAGLAALGRMAPADARAALARAVPGAGEPWRAAGGETSEAARLETFLEVWDELRARAGREDPGALLGRAVERLDLEAAHLAAPDGERRRANVVKAVALARRLGAEGATAHEVAAQLRRLAAAPQKEPEAEIEPCDAVALLSVHQAKGLEWPIVCVPDLGATGPNDARRVARDPDGRLAAAFHELEEDAHHVTTALSRARDEGRRAAAAESRRLLYVALTRARDRLVLSGESGRGGESWRTLIENALAARPELALRIPVEQAAVYRATAEGGAAPGAPADLAAGGGAAPAAASGASAAPGSPARSGAREVGTPAQRPSPRAGLEAAPGLPLAPARTVAPSLQLAVTELAELLRCPRRLWFQRYLGLAEAGPGHGAGSPQDDPGRATARGTLAHALLSEVDLAATPLVQRAQLVAVATRRGHDPRHPGVRRILADVSRFLASAPGKRLAQAAARGALRREVPFLLRLPAVAEAGALYLSGSVDALVEERDGATVIDYKYALPRPGLEARYRLQLAMYVLAAARALPGTRLRARLQFLRGTCAAVDVSPTPAELGALAREAPLAAARGQARLREAPAALGRDLARCTAEGCGFASRCFARPAGAASKSA